MRVLIACEESQAVCIEMRKRGHEAYSCDTQECSGGHPEWHIQGDVLDHLDNCWDMMIAHPPCTRLANSGVRWLHNPPKGKTFLQMWDELIDGVDFYNRVRDADIPMKAIENPIMHKYARRMIKPAYKQTVQPWWFGDKAFKATGLELIGLPDLVATDKLIPPKPGTDEHKEWSKIHRIPPGPERAKLRSKTFPGIARAMAEQWG